MQEEAYYKFQDSNTGKILRAIKFNYPSFDEQGNALGYPNLEEYQGITDAMKNAIKKYHPGKIIFCPSDKKEFEKLKGLEGCIITTIETK